MLVSSCGFPSLGLGKRINPSSWTLQATLPCVWVGLDWGRDHGSVFWTHEITSYILQGCHCAWYLSGDFTAGLSPSKRSHSLGKAAVEWFSSEIIRPKSQLSASPCTPRPHPNLPAGGQHIQAEKKKRCQTLIFEVDWVSVFTLSAGELRAAKVEPFILSVKTPWYTFPVFALFLAPCISQFSHC